MSWNQNSDKIFLDLWFFYNFDTSTDHITRNAREKWNMRQEGRERWRFELTVRSLVMLESSSLAFFETHEPPTLKLVTFVNTFSIFLFLRFSLRVKTKSSQQKKKWQSRVKAATLTKIYPKRAFSSFCNLLLTFFDLIRYFCLLFLITNTFT